MPFVSETLLHLRLIRLICTQDLCNALLINSFKKCLHSTERHQNCSVRLMQECQKAEQQAVFGLSTIKAEQQDVFGLSTIFLWSIKPCLNNTQFQNKI